MKKKILVAGIIIAMLAIAVVGGSLAWFTDTDEATNVFTIGSVEIVQNEDFESPEAMIPVGSNETPNDDPNYIKKVVTVENTGKNAAYVQTFVAIPAALDADQTLEGGLLHIYRNEVATATDWEAVDGVATAEGTQPVATNVTIEGVAYNIYKFRNVTVQAPGAETAAVIEGVYIDQATDLNVHDNGTAYFVWEGAEITGFNAAEQMNIYVATQAVQAEGFKRYDEALDSAFGNAHPWSAN